MLTKTLSRAVYSLVDGDLSVAPPSSSTNRRPAWISSAGAPCPGRVTLEPERRLPIEVVWREDEDSPVLRTFLDVTS
jgi:hypothetical protein